MNIQHRTPVIATTTDITTPIIPSPGDVPATPPVPSPAPVGAVEARPEPPAPSPGEEGGNVVRLGRESVEYGDLKGGTRRVVVG